MGMEIHGDRLGKERFFRVNGQATDVLHGYRRLYTAVQRRPHSWRVQFSRLEAGTNTSIVALRVVGGDEKGTQCLGI
jgi:hypothetical protein